MRISDWSSDVCSSDLISPPRHQLQVDSASFDSVLPPGRGTIRAVTRPLTDINGERRRAHMIPALAYDDGETEDSDEDRREGRVAALARDLVSAVGVEGAITYSSSLGWRGVRREG